MQVRTTYVGTINGFGAICNGEKLEKMVVEEERQVLYADEGKILRNKTTGELNSAVWLKDTTEEDYEEIDEPKSEQQTPIEKPVEE